MTGHELRQKFLDFFAKKGHVIVPSSSLIPDDPSVLLTTAGMQQFKKYYTGEFDPMTAVHPTLGKPLGSYSAVSVQKSFRTSDIEEVGDESHLTFFEMLGHFSFGDYFKKETIEWTHELLTKVFSIAPERISATVFVGDEKIQFDKESYDTWSAFLPIERIRKGPRADNVWGPAGPEGPCGAASEVYVDDLEVATLVFMEYYCAKDGNLTPLSQKGVDVGWGFERLAMILQGKKNIFETDLFQPIFEKIILQIPGRNDERSKRIIADHVRGVTFLLADCVHPSNKGAGYVLRRLIRRAMMQTRRMGFSENSLLSLMDGVIEDYSFYPELKRNQADIKREFASELEKFEKTLASGIKEFFAKFPEWTHSDESSGFHKVRKISGDDAFYFYQSHSLTLDVIKDLAKLGGHLVEVDDQEYERAQDKQREISRAGAKKKFGGHGLLLDTGELKARDEAELQKVIRLHTATHLLHAALRKILGESVRQMGSDITAERTRFDFSFDRKLTDDEKQQIETLVNDVIKKGHDVTMQEMPYQEAITQGALHFFKEKYPERAKVYTIGDSSTSLGHPFSRELCGGPHVQNTKEIGHFRILKEEAVASGVRRIRATVG